MLEKSSLLCNRFTPGCFWPRVKLCCRLHSLLIVSIVCWLNVSAPTQARASSSWNNSYFVCLYEGFRACSWTCEFFPFSVHFSKVLLYMVSLVGLSFSEELSGKNTTSLSELVFWSGMDVLMRPVPPSSESIEPACPHGCPKEKAILQQSYRDIHAPAPPRGCVDCIRKELIHPEYQASRPCPPGTKPIPEGRATVENEAFLNTFDCQEQPVSVNETLTAHC